MALAAAHDVLARESWEGAELSEMAVQALRPFATGDSRIAIDGPKVRLDAGAALALFLAMNELGANAVRHGALSTPEGRVSLHWAKQDSAVDLEWRESGGPRVTAPTRKGLGSRLLEGGLASELGAPAQLIYAPEGLICRIHAPAAG
jgi:two-component sensor histidine kinase